MFRENFAIYTDPRNGGKTAAYTPRVGGTAKDVDGNFRRPFEDSGRMEGSEPWFGCALADVPNAAHGDTVVVDGISYTVRGVENDGTGWVELRLELTDG